MNDPHLPEGGASPRQWSRRDVLRAAGVGLGALSVAGLGRALTQRKIHRHFRLVSAPGTAPIFSGQETQVYRYSAGVRYGPRNAVRPIPGSFVGPTLHLQHGERVAIDYVNQLAESSVVHFHGLHVPQEQDGHPLYTVEAGGAYRYEFDVINRAGTYWYHAHPDMRTGFQVNRGLAGFVIVHDKREAQLGVPTGSYDLPMLIQDKRFNTSNQILHSTGSQTGHLGDRILVNGFPNYVHRCGTRHYRLRLLNGSNSRIFKLAWSDGRPVWVMGTTGGLLDRIVEKPYVMLAPGDRVEVWLDCTTLPLGTQLKMLSLAFENGGPGSGAPPQGTPMDLFTMEVAYNAPESLPVPTEFAPLDLFDPNQAVNVGNSRVFAMEHMGMWTLNGRTFELNGYEEDEIVHLNDLELWEFRNDLGGSTSLQQPHPMHLHGPQFQIVRRWRADEPPWYDSVRDGFVDEGWHDTVLLFPGERVELLVKFTHYAGLFLYHCHNLEHEDMGMMRNYFVRA